MLTGFEEFTQQVEKALSCAEDFVDGNGEVWVRRSELAPRVADAIDRVWDNMATGGVDLDEARDFALRSLRGEL